ncbi:MAG: VPLPA-CTERM sorting domain-containing protein [Gammaproteobacteria bacterium]
MREVFSRISIACVALLTTSVTWAAPVVVLDGTTATDILGLNVSGSVYDVAFEVDTFSNLNTVSNFPFLGDQTTAENALDAIINELNLAGAEKAGESALDGDFNVLVPYGVSGSTSLNAWGKREPPATVWSDQGTLNWNINGVQVFATFTSVPIPAAAWLFGSALGLLGWMRRRTK